MQLPQDFVRLMREQYGTDTADALCHALLETEPEVSIRLNPRKGKPLIIDPAIHTEPIPWCPDAYYLGERPAFTFDPLLHAGAYYVQEASSMYIAELLRKYFINDSQSLSTLNSESNVVALDLCAAPGGKSTLLAGLLPEGSVLVCNEPIAKRAHILSENIQKWTRVAEGEYPVRCYVTQRYPADFTCFTDSFDLLVADVPCSGEGMFRKDEVAIREWSMQNVEKCWQRQREIMQDIWHVLKPGGLLIYSTCTFNHFEDEDNVRWICDTLVGELLEERHFLPGRDRGEGFYCAAIRKNPAASGSGNGIFNSNFKFQISKTEIQNSSTLNPFSLPTGEGWGGSSPSFPRIELSYNEALQYLRREAIRVPAPKGMVLLCYQGYILGPGRCVGNRINNLYPEQWRIRTTYTTPFSLAD